MQKWNYILAVFMGMGLLISGPAFAKSPSSLNEKITRLQFPRLPESLAKRKTHSEFKIPSAADSHAKYNWGLASIGFFDLFKSTSSVASKTIKPCSPSVVVAVIDTGIDYTHPDLVENLWVNNAEVGPWTPSAGQQGFMSSCRDKSCNGIDDDGNGFIDDVVGWDFVNNVPLPYDAHGHGTHIAGIISGSGKTTGTPAGVCPAVSVMSLKYYDNSVLGYSNLQNTIKAIHYAVDNGANIINYSGGGSDPAPGERLAIEAALKKGILFVAAAGNNGQNNDYVAYYPASYPLPNIISVASMDSNSELLSSSNFGTGSVDLAAPGLDIVSTMPHSKYGAMSGTSQATAFVTGAAGLLVSQYENLSEMDYAVIKRSLVTTTHPLSGAKAKLLKNGKLSISDSTRAHQSNLSSKKAIALSPSNVGSGKITK